MTSLAIFPYTDWIERSGLSRWMREDSLWAFPIILILHTVGLAFLVGTNIALDARILGAARGIPLPSMLPFFRVMWSGFWVNAASGVLLFIAYPTKALTNPLFYAKLALVAVGLAHAIRIRREILGIHPAAHDDERALSKALAAGALACWVAAIVSGRLLAYTYTHLMAYQGR